MRVTMTRNIETFPSKQMYPYLSLVERRVTDFYHNIDRRCWLVWSKWLVFNTFLGQFMVSLKDDTFPFGCLFGWLHNTTQPTSSHCIFKMTERTQLSCLLGNFEMNFRSDAVYVYKLPYIHGHILFCGVIIYIKSLSLLNLATQSLRRKHRSKHFVLWIVLSRYLFQKRGIPFFQEQMGVIIYTENA